MFLLQDFEFCLHLKNNDANKMETTSEDIFLTSAEEDCDDSHNDVAGAGVAPVCINPENGQVLVLLGRERFVKGWSSSFKFSAFEGASFPGETLAQTASREFYEESLGLFGDRDEAAQFISDGECVAKISVRITQEGKRHVTILKLVDYDPALPTKFNEVSQYLQSLQKLGARLRAILRRVRDEDLPVGDKEDGDWNVVLSNDSTSLVRTRHAIETMLENPPSSVPNSLFGEAILVQRQAREITRLKIKDDFLEKTSIKYFTIPDLRIATRFSGNGLPGVSLRPYFSIPGKTIASCLPERVLKK